MKPTNTMRPLPLLSHEDGYPVDERDKGGRPRLPPGEQRDIRLVVRLNQREKDALDEKRGTRTRSEFIRAFILL